MMWFAIGVLFGFAIMFVLATIFSNNKVRREIIRAQDFYKARLQSDKVICDKLEEIASAIREK